MSKNNYRASFIHRIISKNEYVKSVYIYICTWSKLMNFHTKAQSAHSQCQMHTMHTLLIYTCMSIQPADKAVEHLVNSYD